MKKIIYYLPFLFLFAFYSCDDEPLDPNVIIGANNNNNTGGNNTGGNNTGGNDDNGGDDNGGDDNTTEDPQGLVGDWYLISFEVSINNSVDAAGQVTETEVLAEEVDSDYTLSLMENGSFTTSGFYSLSTQVSVAGMQVSDSVDDYTNVSGSGTYSVNGNIMTIDGSFFELTFNGIDDSAFGGEQDAEYSLTDNNNTLTISQDLENQDNSNGVSVTSNILSVSVWERL